MAPFPGLMASFPGQIPVNLLIDAHARRTLSPPVPAPPKPKRRRETVAALKRELMEQARRAGWKGKTYHSAVKFARALDRRRRAASPDPASHQPSSPGARP